MYLQKSKNKPGRIYLSFVQGYRQDGKVKHKTIEKIGYLDELEKIYDDPIAHFKQVAEEKNAVLKNEQQTVEINISEKLPDNCRNRKNLGYAIPKAVYETLGLYDLLKYKQRFINAEYNLNSIFSFLVYNRLLFRHLLNMHTILKINFLTLLIFLSRTVTALLISLIPIQKKYRRL